MVDSSGRKRLVRALQRPDVTQTVLAQACGASQSTVSGWTRGDVRPDALQREILARLLGIEPRAWFSPEERASLRRVRAVSHGSRKMRPRPEALKMRARSAGGAR